MENLPSLKWSENNKKVDSMNTIDHIINLMIMQIYEEINRKGKNVKLSRINYVPMFPLFFYLSKQKKLVIT